MIVELSACKACALVLSFGPSLQLSKPRAKDAITMAASVAMGSCEYASKPRRRPETRVERAQTNWSNRQSSMLPGEEASGTLLFSA